MEEAQTDDLARLAEACATPLQVRVLSALIGLGPGQPILLTDLALRIGDDGLGLPANGPLLNAIKRIAKTGVVGLEERQRGQVAGARCWIVEDGVFTALAELAERAARDALAR